MRLLCITQRACRAQTLHGHCLRGRAALRRACVVTGSREYGMDCCVRGCAPTAARRQRRARAVDERLQRGAGAVAGGLIGALVGLGIPESNAQAYEKILREGGIALGVVPRSDEEAKEIKEEFRRLEGDNIVYA